MSVATLCSQAATVDITAVPSSGQAPLPVTLSWSSTGVTTCIKDSVPVGPAGSESKVVTATTTYQIACTGGTDYTDVSWTAPTENVDGSPVPATGPGSIAGYELFYSTNPANVLTATPIVIPADVRTYRITGQPAATYYYMLKAFNVEQQRSDPAGPVSNVVNNITASDSVTVTILPDTTRPVYNVVKRANGFVLVAVGTVPTSTACDRTQVVNGNYAVPVSAVTWSGSVRPIVAVANCETQPPVTGRLGTSATTVYNLVKRANGFVLVAVGTVPLNTTCDATQSVNGHNVVPVSAVTWSGSVKPIVVVAKCVQQ